MATLEKTRLRRLTKLGISKFERFADARRRQAEMLPRLQEARIDRRYVLFGALA